MYYSYILVTFLLLCIRGSLSQFIQSEECEYKKNCMTLKTSFVKPRDINGDTFEAILGDDILLDCRTTKEDIKGALTVCIYKSSDLVYSINCAYGTRTTCLSLCHVTVSLKNVSKADEMLYFCNSTTNLFSTRGESTLNLKVGVRELMNFTQEPEDKTVSQGDTLTLHCAVSSYPTAKYDWFKDGQLISSNLSSGTYVYKDVNTRTGGKYHCVADNRFESVTSKSIFVNVDIKGLWIAEVLSVLTILLVAIAIIFIGKLIKFRNKRKTDRCLEEDNSEANSHDSEDNGSAKSYAECYVDLPNDKMANEGANDVVDPMKKSINQSSRVPEMTIGKATSYSTFNIKATTAIIQIGETNNVYVPQRSVDNNNDGFNANRNNSNNSLTGQDNDNVNPREQVVEIDENQYGNDLLQMENQKEFLSSNINQDGFHCEFAEDTIVKCLGNHQKRTAAEVSCTGVLTEVYDENTPNSDIGSCSACNSCGHERSSASADTLLYLDILKQEKNLISTNNNHCRQSETKKNPSKHQTTGAFDLLTNSEKNSGVIDGGVIDGAAFEKVHASYDKTASNDTKSVIDNISPVELQIQKLGVYDD